MTLWEVRRGRRWTVRSALLIAALALSACTSSSGHPANRQGEVEVDGSPTSIFSAAGPWNAPIPADPVLDDDSADMVAALTGDEGANALLYEYGVPVFEADADTPRMSVTCTRVEDWGPCPLGDAPVPIPSNAHPSSGSDGAMVVIDRDAGRVYNFWQARQTSSSDWTVSWATRAGLHGDGTDGTTGSGINLLAGLVRVDEIRAGLIDHALAFASNTSCRHVFRYPATKTDGESTERPCVPQGARLQLNPDIDVTAIPGITPGEVAVAKALQTYGGYVRDNAHTTLAVAFETPTGNDNPYPDVAEFPWDYFDMPHIPWDQMRVLRQWDGR